MITDLKELIIETKVWNVDNKKKNLNTIIKVNLIKNQV